MIKALTITRNDALLPSYGLEEVYLDFVAKISHRVAFPKASFKKSFLGQVFMVMTSNPNKITSNAIEGGDK